MNTGRNGHRDVLINGMYLRTTTGTATWTRVLQAVLPYARVWVPGFDPGASQRVRYARKLGAEYAFTLRDADIRLHPYWAISRDQRAAMTILDTIHFQESPVWQRGLLTEAAKAAGAIATISTASREAILSVTGRAAEILTPHPDEEFFDPLPSRPMGSNVIRIGYWGGWHARKGIMEFFRAVFASDLPVEIHTTGASGVRHMRVVDHQRLSTGALRNMIDSCDISVYPSTSEGFGLPVYESLLRGKPSIVQPLAVYGEFVRRPAHSLVIWSPTDGPEGAAVAIQRALGLAVDPRSIRDSLRWTSLEAARGLLSGQAERFLGQMQP